jgi:hypothetical protein
MLQLPLVVRLESGAYLSAGGKSLGKITLNDVKAMLAQAYQAPDNFQLRWEQDQEGLWAILEQPGPQSRENVRELRLLTREIISAKGAEVLEIAAYYENSFLAQPVDFCRFLNEIGR